MSQMFVVNGRGSGWVNSPPEVAAFDNLSVNDAELVRRLMGDALPPSAGPRELTVNEVASNPCVSGFGGMDAMLHVGNDAPLVNNSDEGGPRETMTPWGTLTY